MSERDIVEFECVYGTATLNGYAYVDELDDDAPLHFYDANGFETSILPISQDSDNGDENQLYVAFVEDCQFLQFLSDLSIGSSTIDRGTYTLRINGGTQLEVTYEKAEEYGYGEYDALIRFSFGDTIVPTGLLSDLASDIGMTWNDDAEIGYDYENCILVEVDNSFFDSDSDFSEEKKEMESDIQKVLVKQLIRDKDAYVKTWDAYSDYLVETDSFDKFDDTVKGSVANNFEQQLEGESLRDIDNICSDEMMERINNYIRSDEY